MTECITSVQEDELEYERVLNMTMEAGRILLENGAEISRVEDTMVRLANAYHVENCNFFVLSNGIFTTGIKESRSDWRNYAKVQHIPVKSPRLDKVDAINQLSRDIVKYGYSLEKAEQSLEEIQNMKPKPAWLQILSSAAGAAAFCVIFGGSLQDAFVAMIAGFVIWVFLLTLGNRYLGKIVSNLVSGLIVTLLCIGLYRIGFGNSIVPILSGGIIPLVPGIAFVNGIRDIAEGDYISGSVRLLDSLLIFGCISVGSVLGYALLSFFGGGIVL